MDWEEARKRFVKKKAPRPEPMVCVCAHSKYHHEYKGIVGESTVWGACIKLGCECQAYELLIPV